MTTFFLCVHIFLVIMMIGLILFQKTDGTGAFTSGGGGMMSSRGAANLLTRATAILATSFFVTTLLLALMFKGAHKPKSILDNLETRPPVGATVPATPEPKK